MSKKEGILLEGFGFSNFRSVGEDPVFLYPLKKTNVLIGPNNSGKTNILSAIDRFFSSRKLINGSLDYPDYVHSKKADVLTPIAFDDLPIIIQDTRYKGNIVLMAVLKEVFQTEPFFSNSKCPVFWKGTKNYYNDSFFRDKINSLQKDRQLRDYLYALFANSMSYSDALKRVVELILSSITQDYDIEVVHISALRDLYDHNKNSFIDETIITKIKYLSNPDSHDLEARHTMRKINEFVSKMLEYDVKLTVPANGDTINIQRVDNEDVVRNLDQIGSGIQEMIYLAIVSTLKPNQLICIDEPEIHLHPRLLRRLVQYLEKNTECQYIFSTHSNCFLDNIADDLSVFKVSLDEYGHTKVEYAASANVLRSINSQLGNRASELLQSNCVIWVEGPSDRIYINFWIHAKDPSLIEGINYSIMFYGGRLLNHLSSETNPDKELIGLLRINSNSYVVMDRDRSNPKTEVNATKKRIVGCFQNSYWLTQGREIENYLPYDKYINILLQVNPNAVPARKGDYYNRLSGDGRSVDKVEFAQQYTLSSDNCDFSILDLDEQIEKLISFIHKANK